MKRSGPLKLVLLATTAVILSGCGEDPSEGEAYTSVEQCISLGNFTEAECNDAFEAALAQHEESSPRYDSRSLCEQEHGIGNCNPPRNGYYAPSMNGFFLGYLVGNMTSDWAYRSRPIYTSSSGGLYTSSGYRLYRNSSTGRVEVNNKAMTTAPRPARVQTRTSVAARGGFGLRSGSTSWGG